MSSDTTDYIRQRATTLRTRANDPRKTTDEVVRDQMVYAARQLDIVAEELDNDFHVSDEEQ